VPQFQSAENLMHSSMTPSTIAALFCAMAILAAIPSISVLAVATRSAASGFIHGVATTIGILVGDITFILIAILGLSLLAKTLGGFFVLLKYVGGVYLILLGFNLWRSKTQDLEVEAIAKPSLFSSFLTGLLITLGDQKATLFYLGFFPAFLDLTQITLSETLTIILIAILAVGGVKLIYALMADRARLLINAKRRKVMNAIAGCVMMTVGIFLLIKP
jgi:threonine/homoserine/homoserine lactone efflux protein